MEGGVSVSTAPSSQTRIDATPYLVGAGIGVLCWIAFGLAHDPLGVTTAYGRVASLFAIPVMGSQAVAANTYWKAKPFSIDYGVVFLVGLALGAFVSAALSRQLSTEAMSSAWKDRFGSSLPVRLTGAFFGGAVVMYGARMAGGCTSGHGISGTLQLALSSWVFLLVMFAAGAIAAAVLFRNRKAQS